MAGLEAVFGGAGEVADLGREHDLVARNLGDQPAEEALGSAVAVDIGGVIEAGSMLPGRFQTSQGACIVAAGGPAHGHTEVVVGAANGPAADADGGHRDPGGAELAGRDPRAVSVIGVVVWGHANLLWSRMTASSSWMNSKSSPGRAQTKTGTAAPRARE